MTQTLWSMNTSQLRVIMYEKLGLREKNWEGDREKKGKKGLGLDLSVPNLSTYLNYMDTERIQDYPYADIIYQGNRKITINNNNSNNQKDTIIDVGQL